MNWPYRRFKLAALFAFLSFYLYTLTTAIRGQDAIFMWLLLSGPSLVILCIPKRGLSVARGLAMGQSLVFGSITGFIGFVGVFVWVGAGDGRPEVVETIMVFIAHAALFFAAIRMTPELNGIYDRSSIITWFTTAITVVSLVLAIITLEDISKHNMTPDAAYRVVACAEAYADNHAENHKGEYPESLEAMVQTEGKWSNSNCIYFRTSWSPENGQVRYAPVRSADGRVLGYSILFGPRTFLGNLKTAEFIDQSGIVRKPKDHPIASASDPVKDNISTPLAEWSQCLVKYRQAHPGVPFPKELKDMLSPDWPCKPQGAFEGNRVIKDNNYTVFYKSPCEAKPGDASSFSLQARPNQYGESGIRSYYVDEDGIIRATVKNRAANKNDAPIPTCEWNVGTPC
jgi:hypothetical protein